MKPNRDFTIIDVFRFLNLELMPADTWEAGAKLRDLYLSRVGKLPEKELRPKTGGTGTHCFAVYPPLWWDDAVSIANAITTQKANQMSLF